MIYQIKRGSTVIFEHEIRGNRTQSAPAVDFVDVEFDYKEAILFKNNDTIDFDGETYYCDKQYNSVLKKSTNLYNHRARFLSENYRATEIALLDPQGLHIFEIEGNLLTLLTLAVNRLNTVSSGWSYDTPPTTVTKTFQIDGQNVMEFLARVSSEFEIPFYVQDKVIYYKDPALVDAGNFEYGKGNGFLDIRKSYKSGEKIPNTVYASGGDDLVLDAPVVNNGDITTNGVIEGFYSNENIKPTTRVYMEGVVTADNVVTTTQINYDIQAQKIAGQTPLINFETGALGGLSFYITNSTYDTNTNVTVIYLKKRTVDGELLPNNTVRALAGDYFNITNIRQPQIIVDEALFKLGQYATADMSNRILNNMGIEATLDPLFPEDLKLNDSITIIDDNLELAGRFFILEIKTDLQNLNKKDLVLGRNFRYLNIPGLNVKNDNVIDLGIQNNYDDLVVIEEEVDRVKVDVNDLRIKNAELGVVVADLDVSVEAIKEIDLPSKENINNKVSDLERTDARYYPTVTAVNSGLLLKQNKLVQGNNININQTTNTISVPNATSTQAGAVQTFSNTVQNVGANSITSVANRTYGVQNNASGQLVVNVPLVDYSDLDGFIYDVTYNSSTHTITFFQQNEPNIVIDLPIEQLIKGVQLVGDDLVFTFEDGSTVTVPLNTLLVGVVKSVNGKTPNSQGEIILNVTDIPNLSSELANKLDIRMAGLVSNLTQPEKDAILSKLGVVNNIVQVLGLSGNTITLSNGGGSISLNIANIGGLQTALNSKVDLDGSNSTGALLDSINKRHDAVTLGTPNGLSLSGQVISLGLASASTNGALSSTDWNNFNNKLDASALNGYATETWANSRFSLLGHTHPTSEVIGLDNALNSINIQISNKANVNASNISITNVPIWRNVLDVYSTTQVDGFLAGKANINGYYSGLHVGNADKWNNQSYNQGRIGSPSAFMVYNGIDWGYSTVGDMQSALGINTSWDLQQVTNNGDTSTLSAEFNGVRIGFTAGGYLGFNSVKDIAIFNNSTSSGAGRVLTGGLLASDDYVDASLIPANGAYFKGNAVVPNATASNHAVAFGQLANYALSSAIPTNVSQLVNDANYITVLSNDFVKNTLNNNDANIVSETIWTHSNTNLPSWFPVDQSGTLLHKEYNSSFSTQLAMSYYGGLAYRHKSYGNFSNWYKVYSTLDFDIANYALLSQVPTNVSQLVNDANYTTLPIVQSWIGTQGYLTSFTETDPTVPSHVKAITTGNITNWNSKTSNLGTVTSITAGTGLSGGTITTSGTIDLSATTLSNISLGVTANSWGNHAGLYPLLSGSYANPTWITSLDWSKISNKPTIPNAPNNGIFTVQGINALTGGASTSADTSLNTTAQLDLTQSTKDDIQRGVTVYNEFPSVKEGVSFNNVSTPFTTNISIITKKTIVNISAGVINGTVQVEDGLYDGYELAFNGCGEWSIDVDANIQDKCGIKSVISLSGDSALFWWSVNDAMWIQAI